MCQRLSLMTVVLLALAGRLQAAEVDAARVKACVAGFLGVPEDHIEWPEVIMPPDGKPSWFHAIHLRLPEPAPPGAAEGGDVLTVAVHPRDYYVKGIAWRSRLPRDDVRYERVLDTQECLQIAEQFVRSKVQPWPKGMKLSVLCSGPLGAINPYCQAVWEEWAGEARTGTRVVVFVNPCPPGAIFNFGQYLAPPHSLSEVKIGREEALRLARDAALKLGLENPRVLENETGLWLSEPSCERPHWKVGFDYDNRYGGFGWQAFIDAATGEILEPAI